MIALICYLLYVVLGSAWMIWICLETEPVKVRDLLLIILMTLLILGPVLFICTILEESDILSIVVFKKRS